MAVSGREAPDAFLQLSSDMSCIYQDARVNALLETYVYRYGFVKNVFHVFRVMA